MRKLMVVFLAAVAVVGLAIGATVLRPQLPGTTASPGALVRPQPGGVTAAVPEAGGAAPRTSQPGPADQAGQSQLTDRMIIYNVTLQLEVERVRTALARIEQIAQAAGGYVVGSNVGENQAQVTIRVPAAELNRTLEQLRAVGTKVKGEQLSSRDVTEEFSDLSAQLRNLQAVETQYLALLQQARTVDEILKVRQRLDEIRGQIERLQGRIEFLRRQSDLAAVTISLTEAPAAAPDGGPAWDPIQAVVAAWNRSLVFLSRVADVAVQAVVFLWWVWVPAGLGFGFWRYLGRRRAPGAPTANP
jgi:hypothetical protein